MIGQEQQIKILIIAILGSKKFSRPYFNQRLELLTYACHPSYIRKHK
jgi:hypothetical protein